MRIVSIALSEQFIYTRCHSIAGFTIGKFHASRENRASR